MGQERDAPLFWPLWVLGTVLLLVVTAWFGLSSAELASVPRVPYLVSLIAAGAPKLPPFAYAAGFVPLAVGASLGASSARRSLILVLVGTALMSLPMILAILLHGLAGLSQQQPANGISPGVPMLVFLMMMAPTGFFLVCKPIAIGAAVLTLLIHLVLNVVNDLPLPWQRVGDEDGEAIYEIGGSAIIVLLALWTFAPAMLFGIDPLKDDGASAEEIVAALDPPYKSGTWISTPAGRDRMRHWSKEISSALKVVANNQCDERARKSLKFDANRYFDHIRIYEDWKPNQPLSEISSGARGHIEDALNRGFLGWQDLVPPTRIHLDAKKYQTAARTYPSSCGT